MADGASRRAFYPCLSLLTPAQALQTLSSDPDFKGAVRGYGPACSGIPTRSRLWSRAAEAFRPARC